VIDLPKKRFQCKHKMSLANSYKPASLPTTTTSYPTDHTVDEPTITPWFIDNKFVQSSSTELIDLFDPATNQLVTRVPQNTQDELVAAVDSAEKAFPSWKQTSVLARQQIMFKFVALIRENWDRLAAVITLEQGKTVADAKGDVLRGLQVAEAACAAPELLKGEVLPIGKDLETRTYLEPLGVVAAICPFSMFHLRSSQSMVTVLTKMQTSPP
jgi:malonate-semialdehyde dehydrogenase (acetylating)/methylmalonate-semialdehyde dehydrogenase